MNDSKKPVGLRSTAKARRIYRARWLVVTLAPILVGLVLLSVVLPDDWDTIAKSGLVQPAVATLLALTVVLSMRLTWGRYLNDRRKGVTSASSATIAVKLWALCFALLLGSMLLSALVARLPQTLTMEVATPPKAVVTQVEVSSNQAAPAVASVKVTQ